ncbi:MAG: DUF5320 domain-containing protein [Candidatus Nanoarchaeia archaeon]
MPGFDGTGPYGTGPVGLGLGPCGRGLAFRRGYGRWIGWRCWRRLPVEEVAFTKEEEKKILEAELKEFDAKKQAIEKRLKELK